MHFIALLGSIGGRLEGFLTECQSENSRTTHSDKMSDRSVREHQLLTKCRYNRHRGSRKLAMDNLVEGIISVAGRGLEDRF